jgi:predicted alpha/beta hydrolase family esterase
MRNSSNRSALEGGTVLLVPGIGNSGPEHWQSYWELRNSNFVRVQQRDWEHPVCSEWADSLEAAVESAGPQIVIAAHSLGCLLVAHWLTRTSLKIAGALLVAIPNPEGPDFPSQAEGFAPLPRQPISCPSTIVASTDDPYGDIDFAHRCADDWGSRFINIGNAGHINASSGLGEWEAGQDLLRDLRRAPVPA